MMNFARAVTPSPIKAGIRGMVADLQARTSDNGEAMDNRLPGILGPRLTFHHIPKTAGTSFDQWIRQWYRPEQISEDRTDDLGELDPEGFDFYSGHFYYDTLEDKLGDTDWIVLLRDPVKRVISQYQNWHDRKRVLSAERWQELIERHPQVQEAMEISAESTFAEWVRSENATIKDAIWNTQTRRITRMNPGDRTYVPEIIEDAKSNLFDRFGFFGLTERYADGVLLFAWQFGVRPEDADLWPKMNVTAPSARITPDEDTLEYVREINRMDIELYEAALEEFDRRFRAMTIAAAGDSWRLRHWRLPDNRPTGRVILDERALCAGFGYAQRNSLDQQFRWTIATEASVDVVFPEKTADRVEIEIKVLASNVEGSYQQVLLSLDDGEEVSPRFELGSGTSAVLHATLPVHSGMAPGGLHKLTIRGPVQTFVPPDRPDWVRTLGLAVSEVSVTLLGSDASDD